MYFFPLIVDFVFHEPCHESELVLCIFQKLVVRPCLIDYRVLQCLDYPCEMSLQWEAYFISELNRCHLSLRVFTSLWIGKM